MVECEINYVYDLKLLKPLFTTAYDNCLSWTNLYYCHTIWKKVFLVISLATCYSAIKMGFVPLGSTNKQAHHHLSAQEKVNHISNPTRAMLCSAH